MTYKSKSVTPTDVIAFFGKHYLKKGGGMNSILQANLFSKLNLAQLEALENAILRAKEQKVEDEVKAIIIKLRGLGVSEKKLQSLLKEAS